ncbi:MAG: DNA/RNA nuclease SfsA [Gammaproteobacteria bacterium]|nr:DNA/RNA nuclease SfsA [Gammaproteobacteria bacterium]
MTPVRLNPPLARGTLRRRYKRFLADVVTAEGRAITMFCPNTGAMLGCSEPGSTVWFSASNNPTRKYRHTLEVVLTALGRVGVNTARANDLVAEALDAGGVAELTGYGTITREVRIPHENGRFDFLLSEPGRADCYVEVKSLTLGYPDGTGAFPDTESKRALRHVRALEARVKNGERAVLLYCVQHTGIRVATTADDIYPAYGEAVRSALDSGVEVLARSCRIERDEISLGDKIVVRA